jgi:hypothetical protein
MGGTGAYRTDDTASRDKWVGTAQETTGTANWSGVYSGAYGSRIQGQGNYGTWFSSTALNVSAGFGLYVVSSSTIKPLGDIPKLYAYAVRCVI